MSRSLKRSVSAVSLLLLYMIIMTRMHSISYADNDDPNATTMPNEPEIGAGLQDFHFFGALVKVILVLIVIIGLIVLIIYFLSQKNKSWMANRSIRLLAGLQLGPNKSVQVIEIGRSIYLVGVGDQVQLIDKIEDADEVEHIIESLSSPHTISRNQIIPKLTVWLQKKLGPRNDKAEEDDASTFQEIFQNKIKLVSGRKKMVEELMNKKNKIDRSSEP